MARCLSLSIIHLLHCNRREWRIWDHISSSRPCMLAPFPSPLFLQTHLLGRGPSREWPWTRADLAASPQPDVIRLSRKEKAHAVHLAFRLVFGALWRGWGEQIELSEGAGLCGVCVWLTQALVFVQPHKTRLSDRHWGGIWSRLPRGALPCLRGLYSLRLSFGFWWSVHHGLIVKRS